MEIDVYNERYPPQFLSPTSEKSKLQLSEEAPTE